MNGSWRQHFQVGIIHSMIFPSATADEDVLATMATIVQDPFFGAIEIAPLVRQPLKQQVIALLAQSGMQTIYCGSGMCAVTRLNLGAPYREEASAAVNTIKQLIDDAYEVGSRVLVIAGGPDPGVEKRSDARAQLVESLRELRDYAFEKSDGYSLTIGVETFDRDIDKKQLLGPTLEAREVIEAAADGKKGLGLVLDLSHIPLVNESPTEAVEAAGEWLVHAHMGNSLISDTSHTMYGDQHPRFGVPGSEVGTDKLAEYLRALHNTGYFSRRPLGVMPVVSFEVKPRPDENSLTLMASSKRAFLDAWAMV